MEHTIIEHIEKSGEYILNNEITEVDSRGNKIEEYLTYILEVDHGNKKILSVTLKEEKERRELESTFKAIKDWGIISWFNYGGRLGMWGDPMDAIECVKSLENEFVRLEDFERAEESKNFLKDLIEYMKSEEIYKESEK